jgi:hypothetical protein
MKLGGGHAVVVGRAARRAERAALVESVLGTTDASAGLDLLELTELAWHDCYGEVTPPDEVILNILICSRGKLAGMVQAAHLAVTDWRDLQLWAADVRSKEHVDAGPAASQVELPGSNED